MNALSQVSPASGSKAPPWEHWPLIVAARAQKVSVLRKAEEWLRLGFHSKPVTADRDLLRRRRGKVCLGISALRGFRGPATLEVRQWESEGPLAGPCGGWKKTGKKNRRSPGVGCRDLMLAGVPLAGDWQRRRMEAHTGSPPGSTRSPADVESQDSASSSD